MPEILPETHENPNTSQTHNNNGQKTTPTISVYEQSREDRIKENLQRMQKLGIVDLSLKLKSLAPPKRTPRCSLSDSRRPSSALPSGPLRRSSRLQNVTPVIYSEALLSKKDKSLEDEDVKLEEGSKPELYTEEHEKLLGNTERSWTLFVDGYGKDGRRIYDPVHGKTCHQCRQKTLGYRTHCSKCNMVQGQFCGDCLYMRYGEHVLEAIENPNWICPACRGICNCSFCRQAKGWCPTGALYRKISSLGFKSVAHYLIQTRRMQINLEKDPNTINQVSAKRSLSFSDMELLWKECTKVDKNQLGSSEPQSEDKKHDKDLNIEKENKMQGNANLSSNHQPCTKRSLPFSDTDVDSVNVNSAEVECKVQNHFRLSELKSGDQIDNGIKSEQGGQCTDKVHNDSNIALRICPKPKMKRAAIESTPESIGGRVRQRRRLSNGHNDTELIAVNEKSLDVKQEVSNILSEKEPKKEKEMDITDDKHVYKIRTLDGSPKLKSTPTFAAEPSRDSTLERYGRGRGRGIEKAKTTTMRGCEI